MKITNCELKKRVQKKLLDFFILEVTARSAADILGIRPNSAIPIYRKIRMVISHHLALAADEIFDGAVANWMRAISADAANVVAVQQEKWLSSAF